jgi:hypothetical protein
MYMPVAPATANPVPYANGFNSLRAEKRDAILG